MTLYDVLNSLLETVEEGRGPATDEELIETSRLACELARLLLDQVSMY